MVGVVLMWEPVLVGLFMWWLHVLGMGMNNFF